MRIEIGKEYIEKENPRQDMGGSNVYYRLTHLDDKNAYLLAVNDLQSIMVSLDLFKEIYVEGCE